MEFAINFDHAGQFLEFGMVLRDAWAAISSYFRHEKEELWRRKETPLSIGFSQDPEKGVVIHFVLEALMDKIEAECFRDPTQKQTQVILTEFSRLSEKPRRYRGVIENGELRILGQV